MKNLKKEEQQKLFKGIEKKLGKENYLNIKYENSTQSLKIIGDNARLTKELGFKFKYNHTQAVAEILSK